MPTLWNEWSSDPGQPILEFLIESANRRGFAIFILTRFTLPSVMAEIGFMAGRIGLQRVLIVLTESDYSSISSGRKGVMVMYSGL